MSSIGRPARSEEVRIDRVRGWYPSRADSPLTVALALAALAISTAIASCSGSASSGAGGVVTLRLGYLPNLTHAPALVGVGRGIFARDLGPGVRLETQTFNAGPSAVTALAAGSLDAAFVGPSAALTGYVRSGGEALRIVAGATSGGAGLVVRADEQIERPEQLRGKTLATPQLGNTQDVALRAYLAGHGIHVDPQGGGDATVVPTDNSTTLQLFKQRQIDGAWVPEPFLTRLLVEDGGSLLVDEASLWPGGRFTTTDLVVSAPFLAAHGEAVRALVRGELDAIDVIAGRPASAKDAVNAQLERSTQKRLPGGVLDPAWRRLTFTPDPVAASLRRSADEARRAGVLSGDARLEGIYDLRPLNELLRARRLAPVESAGLGPS